MLLDAASLYFRAFYGVPTSVTTPDGRPINAVRGFLDMTARLLTTHGPDRLVACWDDDWRPAFRVEALPSYKAHRLAPDGGEEVPGRAEPAGADPGRGAGRRRASTASAPPATRPTTSSARWPPGRAARSTSSPATGTSSSSSTTPAACGCSTPPAGSATSSSSTRPAVTAKYGIPGRAYADFAVLRGDPSDGLPGVAGVGAKTAAALINEFGDLAGIRAAVARTVVPKPPLTAAVLKKMHAAGDYLDAAPVVVAVACDIDLPPIEGNAPPHAGRPGRAGRAGRGPRPGVLARPARRRAGLAGGRAQLIRARSTCTRRSSRR